MSLGAMGFPLQISQKIEHEKKLKRGFQVLSGLEEKRSITNHLTLMTFQKESRRAFYRKPYNKHRNGG